MLRIGIGEPGADVAKPGAAEQGVSTGVGDDIGIAMAEQGARAGEHHPTQDQGTLGVVHPRVGVEAVPDAQCWHATTLPRHAGELVLGTPRRSRHPNYDPSPMVDVALIASTELFAELPEEYLEILAGQARVLELRRGDVLFEEDDEADALYLVVSGRVAISNRSFDGRESMVALMEADSLFGEFGLFDGMGRSAQARALERSTVVEIPYGPVRLLYHDHPDQLWRVVEMLARRLRSMDAALADSVFLDVTGRTAKRMLELAGENDEFELPITQEELAGMVGASRERVNKAIASFIRLGWIVQRDRRYQITNREQLEIRAR